MVYKSKHKMHLWVSYELYTRSLKVILYNIFSVSVTCHTRSGVEFSTCVMTAFKSFRF
jgi:hypothetical protein